MGGHEIGGHEIGGHEIGGHEVAGHDAVHGAGDTDVGHTDLGPIEATGSHMPEFAPISPVTIFMFVTCFGGAGMILTRIGATNSPWIHLPLSLLAGFGGAAVVFAIFSKIFSMTQSSSELRVAGMVGLSATVIIPIPENGMGEIAYVIGGSRYNSPAREETGQPVASGAEVKIMRVVGGTYYVKKA
jgi:membrane protein implicated in regulation of membrane protease activity